MNLECPEYREDPVWLDDLVRKVRLVIMVPMALLESKVCLDYHSKDRKAYRESKAFPACRVVTDKRVYQVPTALQEDRALKGNEALKDRMALGL